MGLEKCETIIQQIMDDLNLKSKESGNYRLLMRWRAKLENEPPQLSLYQIDEIVREVRRRLNSAGGSAGHESY